MSRKSQPILPGSRNPAKRAGSAAPANRTPLQGHGSTPRYPARLLGRPRQLPLPLTHTLRVVYSLLTIDYDCGHGEPRR